MNQGQTETDVVLETAQADPASGKDAEFVFREGIKWNRVTLHNVLRFIEANLQRRVEEYEGL